MIPFADQLVVVRDEPDWLYLDTSHVMKNGKPLYFGAVRTMKKYVSYHLMPVYVKPALLEGMSDSLRKRMQGKSCFNFVKIDKNVFDELATLTRAGFDFYRSEGYIQESE